MKGYAEETAARKENVLENMEIGTNRISGQIHLSENKILCLAFPYSTGWTAWVDGEKTDIQKVNYQYMGLNLTPGTHSIRLHYQLPGLHYAFLITAGGAGVFVLIILFNFFRKRRRRKMAE